MRQRDAARDEYLAYLEQAWRRPEIKWSTGDPWADAVIAWSERGDIKSLLAYRGVGSLSAAQIRDLFDILGITHARTQKRNPGKPSETVLRWRDPNYIAAWVAEKRIAVWKRDNGKSNIPAEDRRRIVDDIVDKVRTWAFAKRKRPTTDRVLAILSGPKSRRLPI
jgi:hypothetical protein